jgi:hypothetical protein
MNQRVHLNRVVFYEVTILSTCWLLDLQEIYCVPLGNTRIWAQPTKSSCVFTEGHMTHISTTSSKRFNLYMMIKPEGTSSPFSVSLWATWSGESGPRVMAAPEASWHDFASRLENTGLLDRDSIGSVDAHVGRGEPTVRYVSCSLDDL